MQSKISHDYWSDAKIEPLTLEQSHTALWLMTNSHLTIVGYQEFSLRRFEFESKSPPQALASTLEALPTTFERLGKGIWIRNFIRRQFGDGNTLARNNMAKALVRCLEALHNPLLTARVVAEYPILHSWLSPKPSPSPPQGQREEKRGEEKEQEKGSAEGKSHIIELTEPEHVLDRLCPLFGGAPGRCYAGLSYEAQHKLAQLLPMPEEEIALVLEFFRLEQDERGFPKRPESVDKLILGWSKTVDSARGHLGKITRASPLIVLPPPSPPGIAAEEWLQRNYPDDFHTFGPYAAWPKSVQDSFHLETRNQKQQ